MRNLHHLPSRQLRAVFILFLFLLAQTTVAFAAVTFENQTGTVVIEQPTGEVATVEAGQTLPPIQNDSKLELVTGSGQISASEGETLHLVIPCATVKIQNAVVNADLGLETGNGTVEVLSGEVEILKDDGSIVTLEAGRAEFISCPARTQPLGADPVENVGRQKDAEEGKVSGY
ncbi:MAG: hypothetical protein HY583_04180 [Candidatus Omnitrophica bacterium]|nr:hypothetical protein [Candidatus Omnitrophota bacterium]